MGGGIYHTGPRRAAPRAAGHVFPQWFAPRHAARGGVEKQQTNQQTKPNNQPTTERDRHKANPDPPEGGREEEGERGRERRGVVCGVGEREERIWLILPVVVCFVQGLSHACLSANGFRTVGL